MAKEMTPEERQLLSAWIEHVTARSDLGNVEVPLEELLALAGVVATGVARPAVPVTAYLAGYLAAVRAQHPAAPGPAQVVQDVIALVPASTTASKKG